MLILWVLKKTTKNNMNFIIRKIQINLFLFGILMPNFIFFSCQKNTDNAQNTQEAGKNTENNTPQITLTGNIQPAQKGWIKVEKFADNNFTLLDSVELKGTTFSVKMNVSAESDFYKITLLNKRQIPLVLSQNDKNVKISVDANTPSLDYKITGSPDSEHYQKLNSILENINKEKQRLGEIYNKAQGNPAEMERIEEEFYDMQRKSIENVKKFIGESRPSIVSIVASNTLVPEEEFEFLKNLAEEVQKKYPNSPYTQKFTAQIAKMETQFKEKEHISIGKIAPDIALPTPDGGSLKISDLKGKYVILDFWASWCRPCRAENPKVVKLYQKYKDKGLEILGISLDKDAIAWKKAIADDNLTWKHISDLKFWQSEASQLYKVQSIPATFLLDKEGKIIAKDLRGKALEKKMEEIFK